MTFDASAYRYHGRPLAHGAIRIRYQETFVVCFLFFFDRLSELNLIFFIICWRFRRKKITVADNEWGSVSYVRSRPCLQRCFFPDGG